VQAGASGTRPRPETSPSSRPSCATTFRIAFVADVAGGTYFIQVTALDNPTSGISVSGDYTQTNNCAAVAPGAACVINISFAPTAAGSRSGSLAPAGNASFTPQQATLSGYATR